MDTIPSPPPRSISFRAFHALAMAAVGSTDFISSGPVSHSKSFPSGHAAVAAAVMSVLWILYPRLRVAWGIGIVGADAGLVALNFHFLSDVVAGSFVGASTGLFTVALWRASRSQGWFSGAASGPP